MILVDKCLFINRSPFKDNLEISFKEGVNVLCGINGRGKTTILSYIVDAFYEMAKPNYRGSLKVRSTSIIGSHLHFILLIQVNRPLYIYVSRLKKGQLITLMFVGSLLKLSTMTW